MSECDDVHIVTATVTAREEWEREQLRRLLDAQRRATLDLEARDRYEEQQRRVREAVAARLMTLLESLEPYVDGTMGEVPAGLAAVYVRAAGQLAALYGAAVRPRPAAALPVWPEPAEETGGEERAREAAAVARAAVAEQLERVRERLALPGKEEDPTPSGG